MSSFQAEILTPEGTLFKGEVNGVQMPGTMGRFEVKANHAPIVSTLDAGPVLVRRKEGNTTYTISGGFVEVASNNLTLIAESVG